MKKIILILSICIGFMTSCSDDFLDRPSLVDLSEEGLWKTEDDVVEAINALYNANREFTNNIVIYGMMDDFSDIAYQSWAIGMTTGLGMPANWAFFLNNWGLFYKGIIRANKAIEKIPDMAISEELKNRTLGEAYFFRGYFYFKLLDYWGGVPIYTEPINPSKAYKARSTEDQVCDQIVKDMTLAYDLLPSSYSDTEKGRATKWAAMSVRGKAKLWVKRYEEAAKDFEIVMSQSDRSLVSDYATLFHVAGNNNSEVIFDVQYVAESGHGIATDVNYGSGSRNVATAVSQRTRPTPTLVDAFEMADGTEFSYSNFTNASGGVFDPSNANDWNDEASVRKLYENRDPRLQKAIIVPWSTFVGANGATLTYMYPQVASNPLCYTTIFGNGSYAWRKFVEEGNTYTLRYYMPQNFPLIRLADVILMYAEAQNEALSSPDQSVYNAVNQIRDRAGMPNLPSGLTQAQMREKIRHERMVELCGEGMRYSDIRRWKIAESLMPMDNPIYMTSFVTSVKIRQKGFPYKHYLWAIPQQERDLNPLLEQNPDW